MQVFRIRQDGFVDIKKKVLFRSIPILLIVCSLGIIFTTLNHKPKENVVGILPIYIPLVASALGIGIYRAVNRQKALFESYILTITNNLITREQLNTPTISIYINEIQEIAKNKNGSFTIKGNVIEDLIGIPLQIDNYSQLEILLQQIQPIVVKDRVSLLEKYQSFAGLVTGGLMLCVYFVNNKIIVGLTGSLLIAFMIWSFIKIRQSKNVDNTTKRSVWWVVLVLISVVSVMIIKLTGILEIHKH